MAHLDPKPAADRIDGEIGRRIRLLREARRLSMAEVALKIGKSIGFMSQVERGLSSLAIRDIVQIAEVLGIDFLALVSPPEEGSEASPVRRASASSPVLFHSSGITKRSLTPASPGFLHLYEMGLELGASTGEQLYQHDGEESGVVMDGAIRLMVGTQDFVLQKGDSFRFASTIPHGFANAAEGQSTVLWVNATRSTSAG